MWWRKEKAKPPFTGSSFDAALKWCRENNEQIEIKSADAFDVQLGPHVVHVERFEDDDWLHAWAVLPDHRMDSSNSINLNTYEMLAELQIRDHYVNLDFKDGIGFFIRFLKLAKFQGDFDLVVFNMLSIFDYLLNKSESRLYPSRSVYFYIRGKRFESASSAAAYYFSDVLNLKRIENNDQYYAYDTGGMVCTVSKNTLDHEFLLRYGFTDLEADYSNQEFALSSQLVCGAYRALNPKVMSYLFKGGISEMAISGVLTEGTEAMPIFDRTLAELTQVVLDSMELIKMNPGLVKGTQVLTSEAEALELVSKYHGAKTGGAENLVE